MLKHSKLAGRKGRFWRIGIGSLALLCLFLLVNSGRILLGLHEPKAFAQKKDTIVASPIASRGCNQPVSSQAGMSVVQSLVSGGITRTYLLHLPKNYQNIQPHALLLSFHGHSSNSLQQQYRTDFSALSDQLGMIVVYPQGVIGPDQHTGWATGPAWNPQVGDVLFTSDLLNHLQATLCIDPTRIYATGFSNGGGMTNLLACDMSDRIAAFASVSGAYPPAPDGCHPARAVPFLEIHGTLDSTVPYTGLPRKDYPPIPLWLHQWAQRDNCTKGPIIFFHAGTVLGERWSGCLDGATLVHYRISNLGHTWPLHLIMHIKSKPGQAFDATPVIWAFLKQYTLPGPQVR